MKNLTKLCAVAALTAATVTALALPANAGVSVGIGIGVPGPAPVYHPYPGGRWCYWHPGACAAPAPTFVVGTFYPGRGWWDGHGWYRHRDWDHDRWHYR